jgi:hypothetical protein
LDMSLPPYMVTLRDDNRNAREMRCWTLAEDIFAAKMLLFV